MAGDIYGEPEIIKCGNVIVTVRSPILTPEEYERRMNRIKQAAISIVLNGKKEG